MSTFNQALGRRLRSARKAAGYTQETIAPLIGVVRSQIANMEVGRSTISAEQVALFARYYGQPVSYFYDDLPLTTPADPPNPPPYHLVAQAARLAAELQKWVDAQGPENISLWWLG